MSGPYAYTLSDTEAAERLGFPVRRIRPILDRHGLCLKIGNRRRLTDDA